MVLFSNFADTNFANICNSSLILCTFSRYDWIGKFYIVRLKRALSMLDRVKHRMIENIWVMHFVQFATFVSYATTTNCVSWRKCTNLSPFLCKCLHAFSPNHHKTYVKKTISMEIYINTNRWNILRNLPFVIFYLTLGQQHEPFCCSRGWNHLHSSIWNSILHFLSYRTHSIITRRNSTFILILWLHLNCSKTHRLGKTIAELKQFLGFWLIQSHFPQFHLFAIRLSQMCVSNVHS